jgi:MFS family permease
MGMHGGGRVGALWRSARSPAIRRFELGYLLFALAEHGTWLAITIYALERGGAREVGLASLVLLLPGAVVAPFAAYAGDRYAPQRALACGYAVQALSMAATAVAMGSGSATLTYVLAAVSTTAITFTRPVMLAMLPAVTHSPAELVAANALTGMIDRVGRLVGPLVGGVLLYFASPTAVFVAGAICTALGAALAVRAGGPGAEPTPLNIDAGGVVRQVFAGFGTLRRSPRIALLLSLLAVAALVGGATDVLAVVFAQARLHAGGGMAGALTAANGAGAILAAAVLARPLWTPRASSPAASGGAAMAGGVMIVAATSSPAIGMLAFATIGAGEHMVRTVASTTVQRHAPPEVMARVFGLVEGIQTGALAIGSWLIAVLVTSLSFTDGLVVFAIGLFAAVVFGAVALRLLGEETRQADEQVVDRLLADHVLAPLPAPAIERLALGAAVLEVGTHERVTQQGERGDRYYLVTRGAFDVCIDGCAVARLGPGQSFGEIALLRDVPRSATVTAAAPSTVIAIERDDFLEAVTGHPRSLGHAEAVVQHYLTP